MAAGARAAGAPQAAAGAPRAHGVGGAAISGRCRTRRAAAAAPSGAAPRSAPCRGEGARRAGGAAMAAGAAQGLGEGGGGGRGFLGPRVPAEVEAMARGVQDVGKEIFRRLLKVTVNALEGKDCRESVRLIAESANLSEEQLAFLISGMYTLLREALRLPLSTFKQEVFKEDLKELRIPEDFIVDFSSVVFGNRNKLGLDQPDSSCNASHFGRHSSGTKKSPTKYPGLQVESGCSYIHKFTGPCTPAIHSDDDEAFRWDSSSL
ncbi:COMM domain-containing protein 5 isoform X2 [Taeniopygia guttata]|uniref:COMM domain-containing protein 5 isoform X2 n=1 Tax=Taeniopygia guttata TaxID=59729 RepID=UPI003BB88944